MDARPDSPHKDVYSRVSFYFPNPGPEEMLAKPSSVGRMSVAESDNILILLGYAIANPTYIFLLQHLPKRGGNKSTDEETLNESNPQIA
jgi:hypothetical protein